MVYRNAATLLVIDVGRSMAQTMPASKTCRFEAAARVARSIVQTRMIGSKTHEFGVVLFGSDETQTSMEDFENVVKYCALGKPNLATIDALANIRNCSGTLDGDFINALIFALNHLDEATGTKKYRREIILFSDVEVEMKNMDHVENIFERMQALNCVFSVCVCGRASETQEGSKGWIKNENIKMLGEMAKQTKGSVRVCDSAEEAMSMFVGKGTAPKMTKIILEVTSGLKVPAQYYSMTTKTSLPLLKKESTKVESDLYDLSAGKVVLDRVYRNPDRPDNEVAFEDRASTYQYGKQFVPVGAASADNFKLISHRCVKFLGTISRKKILRHWFISTTYVVCGSPDLDYSVALCASLSLALARKEIFVKSENGDPLMGALFPNDAEGCRDQMLLQILPFAEDLRDWQFPRLSDPPTETQRTAADAFVIGHTLMIMGNLKFCKYFSDAKPTVTSPILVFDPVQQRLIWRMSEAALNSFLPADLTSITPAGVGNAEVANLKAVLELQVVKANSKKKRKAFWTDEEVVDGGASESQEAARSGVEDTESTAKRLKKDENPQHRPILSIASLNPVEDFQNVLHSGSPDVVSGAMRTMKEIISARIAGGSKAHFRKAVDCLKAFRQACVGEGEGALFNDFLKGIKTAHFDQKSRTHHVWTLIKDSQLSLLTKNDDSSLSVTEKDAEEFLSGGIKDEISGPAAMAIEVDDLFEDMA